tara:strand:- start:2857 stop:3240 length:384 start_codon:yes stop_codon:yes gene_type:complete
MNMEIDHEDERRALFTAFNRDLEDFVAKQVKFARMKKDSVLGGHFHKYAELFYLLEGKGVFSLKDPAKSSKDLTEELIKEYNMVEGDRLFIPAGIAHKALLQKGSVLVGCTEQPYISAKHNDCPYDF